MFARVGGDHHQGT